MNWIPITNETQVTELIERSKQVPCLVFKHSTRCSISSIAKHRLEDDWSFSADEMEAYYLDLISYRSISAHLAEVFQVHHESPQVLLLIDGDCVYDASHLDISVGELKEVLPA
jgi:bacillithiol system protein YtxJ